ncbi:uncharacterized protein EV420DRAFT_1605291 [Desarmillaria tabescens]|uniref:Uncharacterized protein n=1 Tax=Armillaria tabescens TaxID=1929756 RepID=A0AA39J112_ARMTA|nr:uncharacterized protein EV420DRAFT_1605291 [Desarmillaria tabescens]KAK0432478.1 hypothetical protein EV420DRAFT_1605291 [Desarmillaria tabescens]
MSLLLSLPLPPAVATHSDDDGLAMVLCTWHCLRHQASLAQRATSFEGLRVVDRHCWACRCWDHRTARYLVNILVVQINKTHLQPINTPYRPTRRYTTQRRWGEKRSAVI